METNIEKFDPSKLIDGVKDRIKATFVSLIPDDKWDELVKAEVDRWFNTKTERERYGDAPRYTGFQSVCNSLFEEFAKKKISEFLEQYTSNGNSFESGYTIPILNENLKELLISCAPQLFVSAMGGMFQGVINDMKYRG